MKKRYTAEQLALLNWGSWDSDDNGNWSFDTIKTANLVFQSQELRSIRHALERIERLLLSLGKDGLHRVIQHHARKARRSEAQLAAERRRRQEAKKNV